MQNTHKYKNSPQALFTKFGKELIFNYFTDNIQHFVTHNHQKVCDGGTFGAAQDVN